MGILDKLSEKAEGLFGGNKDVTDSILGMIKNQAGGLSGLVEQFKSKGLGDLVSSWVSTGENKPISPTQVSAALGNDQVQGIASKLGVSTDEAAAKLGDMLPKIVDKLTPDGAIPEGGVLDKGLDSIKKLFG